MTRVMALDHGSARCGVAVTDPSLTIVTPLTAVTKPDTDAGLASIAGLCREREIGRVIVGLPVSMDGTEGAQAEVARAFSRRLAGLIEGIPVELMDERLTTAEARSRGGSASEDSRAAAVLLERWLERSERSGR